MKKRFSHSKVTKKIVRKWDKEERKVSKISMLQKRTTENLYNDNLIGKKERELKVESSTI